ncbi:glycosyltransferase [Alphaproteobacteria bacterium]|nr:glycosyltransferase [Alphaproteobacteria bacterium]
MSNKISFICTNLKSGGTQRVVSTISSIYANKGHKVTIITLDNPNEDFYKVNSNIKRININQIKDSNNLFIGIFQNFIRVFKLRKAIIESESKTVISFITSTNIITILASIMLKVNVIVSERNDPYLQKINFKWRALRYLTYPLAKKITANSYKAIDFYKKKFFNSRILYLPNPLPAINPGTHGENVILSIGKLEIQKGHDILLNAFAECIKRNTITSRWKIKIIGSGKELNSLLSLAKKLEISDSLIIKSNINLTNEYKNAGIFIMASRYEGTSNALLEAISSGMPIIVSSNAAFSVPFIRNKHNSIIIENMNFQNLSEEILNLIKDKQKRKEYSINILKDYAEHITNNNIIDMWNEALDINQNEKN